MGKTTIPEMIIRNMQETDLKFAVECTQLEGWQSEILEDFAGFMLYEPQGCFIVEIDDNPIGICVATRYGTQAFLGEIIIQKKWRNKGIGSNIIKYALDYLEQFNVENIYLDSVDAAVLLYERHGFRKICQSFRLSGIIQGKTTTQIRTMQKEDLAKVFLLDQIAFGADRHQFLHRRYTLYPELCKVYDNKGNISGFLMGRKRNDKVWVGPWFVGEDVKFPATMLESLVPDGETLKIEIGVLETNKVAIKLLTELDFVLKDKPPSRMIRGSGEIVGKSPYLFSIGSAAKG